MKKKFILPILTLLVICGFIIHSYVTMSGVFLFVLECIFCVIAIPFVIYTAAMICTNESENMERYTFLSITLTVFVRLAQLTAIIYLFPVFYMMRDGGVLLEGIADDLIFAGITFIFAISIATFLIYHAGTVRPKNTYLQNYELDL